MNVDELRELLEEKPEVRKRTLQMMPHETLVGLCLMYQSALFEMYKKAYDLAVSSRALQESEEE